ncbi:MAG: Wzz/FepE/Etk N-terminal domain-containing protein [Desulfobaccales bacterium]
MNESVNKPSLAENDEVHLLDYLILVAKHSRMIIYASAMVTILVYLYLFITPNKFTATVCILPPQQNMTLSAKILDSLGGGATPGRGAASIGPGGMAASLLGTRSSADMYIGMLNGNTILDRIIERFNLRKSDKGKSHSKILLEDARKELSKRTIILSTRAGFISIEVIDKVPNIAADIANAFIEELDRFLQDLAVKEAKERLSLMEKERLLASQNLSRAEETLRNFRETNGVIQIETQARVMLDYIARLRADIDSKEVQSQVLKKQATPFNYEMVRLETEIKGLKEKLCTAESQVDLTSSSDVCIPSGRTPALGLTYIRLSREVKFQENLYQLYTQMVEMARLDMVRNVSVVSVVYAALPPERRSNKRLFPAITAGAITFFMMVFLVFGREYYRNAFQSEEEMTRLRQLRYYVQQWSQEPKKILSLLKRKKV